MRFLIFTTLLVATALTGGCTAWHQKQAKSAFEQYLRAVHDDVPEEIDYLREYSYLRSSGETRFRFVTTLNDSRLDRLGVYWGDVGRDTYRRWTVLQYTVLPEEIVANREEAESFIAINYDPLFAESSP